MALLTCVGDAIALAANERQLEQIEAKFASHSSSLNLVDSCSTSDAEDMKRFSRKRSNTGGSGQSVVTKLPACAGVALGIGGSTTQEGDNVRADECNRLQMSSSVHSSPTTGARHANDSAIRTYLKESSVLLATGLQTQERYLFLFSDLLLVAKEKSLNNYKLKEKVRLCEVWLRSGGVEEVAECVKTSSCSFVIGWPTTNYVAEFQSRQERDEWFELLERKIQEEKSREQPKVTTVRVYFKNSQQKRNEYRNVRINNIQCGRDLLRLAVMELDLSEDIDYQLWVHSAHENAPYPLYGHECPFAILLSHVRDTADANDAAVALSAAQMEQLGDVASVNAKLKFLLRPRSQSAHAAIGAGGGPSARKTRPRGPAATARLAVSQLKRKVLQRTDSGEGGGLAPTGRLFGLPLHAITHDNSIPEPLMKIFRHIVTEGVTVEGIFRKPPKQSTVKMLKEYLDEGKKIRLEGEHYPLVSASLLKDFLRHLPNKLLVSHLYYEWMTITEEPDLSKKLLKTRRLLSELPPANYQLLRHLLCVLRRVTAMEHLNQMSSTALAVCIGPSLLERPNGADMNDSVKRIPALTQFLIDHFTDLFGVDSARLFDDCGAPPLTCTVASASSSPASTSSSTSTAAEVVFTAAPTPSPKHDSSEESDCFVAAPSGGSIRRQSMPPPETSSGAALVKGSAANESRDSGLSDVHYMTDNDSSAPSVRSTVVVTTLLPPPTPATVLRDYSQSDPSSCEPVVCLKEMNNNDVLVGEDGDRKPTAKSVTNADDVSHGNLLKANATNSYIRSKPPFLPKQTSESALNMSTSWHASITVNGVVLDGDADGEQAAKDGDLNPTNMYSSMSSGGSFGGGGGECSGSIGRRLPSTTAAAPLRNSKRLTIGTLHRTASGEHLVLSESPTGKTPPRDATLAMLTVGSKASALTLSLPTSSTDAKTGDASSSSTSPDEPTNHQSPMMVTTASTAVHMARDSLHRKVIRKQNSVSAEEQSEAEDNKEFSAVIGIEPKTGATVIECNTAPIDKKLITAKDVAAQKTSPSPNGTPVPTSSSTTTPTSSWLRQHSSASSSGASSLSSLLSNDSGVAADGGVGRSVWSSSAETDEQRRSRQRQRRRTDTAVHQQQQRDSSTTVTEASSDDDDRTPVVSRETSRAKELQDKAKVMFHQQQPPPPPSHRSNDGVSPSSSRSAGVVRSPLVANRPLYSWETTNRSPVTSVADLGTATAVAGVSSPFKSKDSKYRPIVTVRSPLGAAVSSPVKTAALRHHNVDAAEPQRRGNDAAAVKRSPTSAAVVGQPTEKSGSGGGVTGSVARPPTYQETMRRRSLKGAADVASVEQIELARQRVSDALRRKTSSTERPPCSLESSPTVTPRGAHYAAPSPLRRIAVPTGVVRENRDRFNAPGTPRRKTLGGEEYQVVIERTRNLVYSPPSSCTTHQQSSAASGTPSGGACVSEDCSSRQRRYSIESPASVGSTNRPLYTAADSATPRTTQHNLHSHHHHRPHPTQHCGAAGSEPTTAEISWSVHRLRSVFDQTPSPAEQRQHGNAKQTTSGGGHHQWLARHVTADVMASTPSGPVRLSDAQANYPVVTPPPLTPYAPVVDASKPSLQLARTPTSDSSAASSLRSGLVRSLANTFESPNSGPAAVAAGAKGTRTLRDESYV